MLALDFAAALESGATAWLAFAQLGINPFWDE